MDLSLSPTPPPLPPPPTPAAPLRPKPKRQSQSTLNRFFPTLPADPFGRPLYLPQYRLDLPHFNRLLQQHQAFGHWQVRVIDHPYSGWSLAATRLITRDTPVVLYSSLPAYLDSLSCPRSVDPAYHYAHPDHGTFCPSPNHLDLGAFAADPLTSRRPNVTPRVYDNLLFLVATRDIQPGEPVGFAYGPDYWRPLLPHPATTEGLRRALLSTYPSLRLPPPSRPPSPPEAEEVSDTEALRESSPSTLPPSAPFPTGLSTFHNAVRRIEAKAKARAAYAYDQRRASLIRGPAIAAVTTNPPPASYPSDYPTLNTAPAFAVTLLLHGKPLRALVDTGAQEDCIRADIADSLRLPRTPIIRAPGKELRDITGILPDQGSRQLTPTTMTLVDLSATPVEFLLDHSTILPTLPFPVILGIPFLTANDFHIHVRSRRLSAQGFTFALPLDEEPSAPTTAAILPVQDSPQSVYLAQDFVLHPESIFLVPATLQGSSSTDTFLFTPDPHLDSTFGLGFSSAVISGPRPMIIASCSASKPYLLPAGTRLGDCTPILPVLSPVPRSPNLVVGALTSAQDPPLSPALPAPEPPPDATILPTLSPDIPPDLLPAFQDLLRQFTTVFENDFSAAPWDAIPFTIALRPDAHSKRHRFYRLSPEQMDILRLLLARYLREGVIRQSSSAWSAPAFFVPKPDGTYRLVIDYRYLNGLTIPNRWPLPLIEELLDTLGGKVLFSKFDAHSGFHQLPIAPESQHLTAFITPLGLFEFTRLPMGVCNGPAAFSIAMSNMVDDIAETTVYLDDTLVSTQSPSGSSPTSAASYHAHLHTVQRFLHRCQTHNLKLNGKKCMIGFRSMAFLGHVVSVTGIAPDPNKVSAIANWATPTRPHDISRFLGLVNYYRAWIPNCAHRQHALTRLLSKKVSWTWTPECQAAFDDLKQALSSAPVIRHYPDLSRPFIVTTDAKDTALGMILSQLSPNGVDQVVAYASRLLDGAETRYCICEKECLALIDAITRWRHFLSRHFDVRTDHQSLRTILTWRHPPQRIARWIMTLQSFSFTATYWPASRMHHVDATSRSISPPPGYTDGVVTSRFGTLTLEGRYEDDFLAFASRRSYLDPPLLAPFGPRVPDPDSLTPPEAIWFTPPEQSPDTAPIPAMVPQQPTLPPPQRPRHPTLSHSLHQDPPDHSLLQWYTTHVIGRRYFDEANDLPYQVTNVRLNAQSHQYEFARTVLGPLPSDDPPDAWFSAEYTMQRVLHAPLVADFPAVTRELHRRYDKTWAHTQEACIPTLQERGVFDNAPLIRLTGESGVALAYRQVFLPGASATSALTPVYQLILPDTDRVSIRLAIHTVHEVLGHAGIDRVIDMLSTRVYFTDMRRRVQDFTAQCPVCQSRKPHYKNTAPVTRILGTPKPSFPFTKLSVDLKGPLPRRSSDDPAYIIVAICHFSKWVIAQALPSRDAASVAKFLIDHIFLVHGTPSIILTDNGTEFDNGLLKAIFHIVGSTRHKFISAFHPQANGQVERVNRFLAGALSMMLDNPSEQWNWPMVLPLVIHAYNVSVHSVTGFTPYFLVHGRECHTIFDAQLPALPPDLLQDRFFQTHGNMATYVTKLIAGLAWTFAATEDRILASQALYTKPRTITEALYGFRVVSFPVGSLVMAHFPIIKSGVSATLARLWDGPFEVVEAINTVTYRIRAIPPCRSHRGPPFPMHISHLKSYATPMPDPAGPLPALPLLHPQLPAPLPVVAPVTLSREILWPSVHLHHSRV